MFVTRHPAWVIVLTLAATLTLGGFASQAVFDDGVAVDNELSAALEVIDERFGDRTSTLQVVVESTDGSDVRSPASLATTLRLQDELTTGATSDLLLDDGQQPAVVSFLAGAEAAAGDLGLDPDDLDDTDVPALQEEGLGQLPDEVAAQVDELLGRGEPPTTALLLVFQDTEGLDDEATLDGQRQLAAAVADLSVPEGITLAPLSFELLTEDSDIGGEVGRLFGTALAIILAVLAIVYWVRPASGHRARMIRRTLADVGLTLLVIVFAVVWMQGLGTLLGPGFAGLIGPFDSQTQVVPILIVGLGVDFSIHLLARYRSETGATGVPATGYLRAFATVGVALLLDTVATAIGFLTNLVSPVEFLATLGVLAAVGIAAAFVLTMTFLPAVRLLLDRRAARLGRLPAAELARSQESVLPRFMGSASVLAERLPTVAIAVAVLLTGVGAYGFTQLGSRFELTDFVPQDDPQLVTFETIQEQFGGGFDTSTEVLLAGQLATPDAHDAQVEALDRAAGVDGVGTFGDEADATSVVSALAAAVAEGGTLAAELAELGLEQDLTVRDDTDVDALYATLLDEGTDVGSGEVLHRDGGDWSARVQLRTAVDQQESPRLRAALEEAFAPVADAGVEVVVTSQQLVQASVSEEIEEAQLRAIAIALAAVMMLLALFFGVRRRRPVIGVLTVLPVAFVLSMTFGMMALTGIPLNPVTATLAALSIGIGVPFNIHVAARYLEERDDEPDGALRRAVSQTGGAVIASALTTGIGFGVLTTSTLLPFEQLGYVIVYAIVLSSVASTLVLPSLLALWERRQAA